jgi:hypothetical protein
VSIYSTIDYLRSVGERDGKERGAREGAARQLGRLLRRHGKRKFGSPPPEQQALLDQLIDRSGRQALEQARDRFLIVQDWAELLAGLVPPTERPSDPAYLLPFEIDPEPMAESIDQHARVTKMSGEPAIVHIRFQRVYRENLGEILYKESQSLRKEHRCPVTTAVILMWTGADGPAMTGEYAIPGGGTYTYNLTRLWERDVEEMFDSLATVSYAPLSKFAPERLPEVVRRMDEMIETKSPDEKTHAALWVVAYSSMGLRYPAEQVNALLSARMPYILDRPECRGTMSEGFYAGCTRGEQEGTVEATRGWVRALGSRRLGEPTPRVAEALAAIDSRERLEQLASGVLKESSWQEVLAPS